MEGTLDCIFNVLWYREITNLEIVEFERVRYIIFDELLQMVRKIHKTLGILVVPFGKVVSVIV